MLVGLDLLNKRQTLIPNFKNYKNLRYFNNIRINYEIKKELGKGQYGEVSLVKKKTTGKEYAMKKIKKRAMNSR